MTVEEKREALDKWCNGRIVCDQCPLNGEKVCSCGCGHYFTHDETHEGHMTDAEIIGAYEIVFGSKKCKEPEQKGATITITQDELVTTMAGVMTMMVVKKPHLMLINDELSTFAAVVAKSLFNKEEK